MKDEMVHELVLSSEGPEKARLECLLSVAYLTNHR